MTLVLLAGMMCDERLFARMPDHIDLSITGHDTVQAIAADVLSKAPETFALGGLSMGGIIAMEIIAQAPDRVTHLALMDTNCEAETDTVKAQRELQIAKAQTGQLDSVIRNEMKPNYLTDGPNRGAVLDLCMDMALGLGPDVFVRQSRALQTRPDQKTTLAAWHKPTLVLCGEDDRLCPLHRHETMANLMPQATLSVIKNAGHLPPLEQPNATQQAIARWLR